MPAEPVPAQSIAVIGGGSWGTTLAWLLADNGHRVRLWLYEPELVDAIATTRENPRYLPGVPLPSSIEPTRSLKQAADGCRAVVFAVPSHAARAVTKELHPHLAATTPVVIATKGIEPESLMLMSELWLDVDRRRRPETLAILSGPSFAKEVCRRLPTAVTLAAAPPLAAALHPMLAAHYFRIYTSEDAIGAQIGGALKNVIALAAGVADGLGLGSNARAALMTRGLAEIVRLGASMGARAETFHGLSGLGDLILTCTGELSRNRAVGLQLGQGKSLKSIISGMHMVAEGVSTAKAAHALAKRQRVEMPIVHEIHAVLFNGKSPRNAVEDLLQRQTGVETL